MSEQEIPKPIAWTTQFDLDCIKSGATGVIFSTREEGDIALHTRFQPSSSAIKATAALIANSLLGQQTEEDVLEVERLILELLGGVKS
jgi:hypothetical protein